MYNKEEIKAILFDLDDTLLNTRKAQCNAICEFKQNYSEFNNLDCKNFVQLWNKITMEAYEKYNRREISFKELIVKRMKDLFKYYSIIISEEEAKQSFKEYKSIYEKNWILFDDAKTLLENIKNKYKLAIISNGDSKQQRKKIEYTGLDKYFSNIIISGEVGYSKPEKEIFELACKMLKVEPKNCIMIGDKYKVDIQGSINCGMQGIWVNRKKENINYEMQISELKELNKTLL